MAELGIVAEPELAEEQGIELRFQRLYADEMAVGAGIGAAPVRAVEDAATALERHPTCGMQGEQQVHQVGAAVYHGGIDHLSATATLNVEDSGEEPHRQIERAAAQIADQRGRGQRRLARFAGVPQGAGKRDVVEVVPRSLRQRARLSPARHAAVDQLRIARQADIRPEAEALHDAGAHAFDQCVGAVDQAQHGIDSPRIFQVQRQRTFATIEDGILAHVERVAGLAAGPLDHDDVGPHVGQQHAAEGPRPDAGDFDDADSVENSHLHCSFPCIKNRGITPVTFFSRVADFG